MKGEDDADEEEEDAADVVEDDGEAVDAAVTWLIVERDFSIGRP